MSSEERDELEELAKDGIVAVGLVLEDVVADLDDPRRER